MKGLNGSVEVLHAECERSSFYVEVLYSNDTAEIGTWLMDIPANVVRAVVRYIFKHHQQIRYIRYRRSYVPLGMYSPIDHRRIKLPSSSDELNARLSSKTRYNMKRERKMLESEIDSLTFDEYEADKLPDNVFKFYMTIKEKSEQRHGRTFQTYGSKSAAEYIESSHVSNVYVMRSLKTGAIVSMVLSCEQCTIPYMHNLAYDVRLSKYSPGKMIYNHYLCELIKKGKTEIFLGGGYYDYKKHYESIEASAFRGVIYRYSYEHAAAKLKQFLSKLRSRIVRILKYVINLHKE